MVKNNLYRQTVEKGALTPWPPLRGGSAPSGHRSPSDASAAPRIGRSLSHRGRFFDTLIYIVDRGFSCNSQRLSRGHGIVSAKFVTIFGIFPQKQGVQICASGRFCSKSQKTIDYCAEKVYHKINPKRKRFRRNKSTPLQIIVFLEKEEKT